MKLPIKNIKEMRYFLYYLNYIIINNPSYKLNLLYINYIISLIKLKTFIYKNLYYYTFFFFFLGKIRHRIFNYTFIISIALGIFAY